MMLCAPRLRRVSVAASVRQKRPTMHAAMASRVSCLLHTLLFHALQCVCVCVCALMVCGCVKRGLV